MFSLTSDAAVSNRPAPRRAGRLGTLMWVMAATDFVLITVTCVLSGLAYHSVIHNATGPIEIFLGCGLIAAALYVVLVASNGFYDLASSGLCLGRLTLIWMVVFTFLTTVAFTLKIGDQLSRASVLSFLVLGLLAVLGARLAFARYTFRAIARGRLIGHRVALVADPDQIRDPSLLPLLQKHGRPIVTMQVAAEVRGDAPRLIQSLRQAEVDEVLLALDWSRAHEAKGLVETLRKLPVPVRLVPDHGIRALVSGRGGIPLIDVQRAPLTWLDQALKRIMDVIGSGVALLLLWPVFLVVAVLIKLDSRGPVFFLQKRMGFNNRAFRIWKFRTMRVLDDGPAVVQAKRDDPRVTRVGRWLRRTSIDELPQLFNVLVGDMSLVGPRPHALAHDSTYERMIGEYALRYHVKPGMTGWAQVNGHRGETPTMSHMERRVEHDLWYISHWRLWLDVRILARTALLPFVSKDVY